MRGAPTFSSHRNNGPALIGLARPRERQGWWPGLASGPARSSRKCSGGISLDCHCDQ